MLGAEPVFEKSPSPDARVRALLFRRAKDGRRVLAVWAVSEATVYRVGEEEFRGSRIQYFMDCGPETAIRTKSNQ